MVNKEKDELVVVSSFAPRKRFYSNSKIFQDHVQSKGVVDDMEAKILFPIDPMTNLPKGDLSDVVNPSLSPAEKERVMSRLVRHDGTYLPANMSDEDILAIIPPRYFNGDQVDVQLWRDYLSKDVLPNFDTETKKMLENSVDEQPSKADSDNEDENV